MIAEASTASWTSSTTLGAQATGSCSNGLGFPTVSTGPTGGPSYVTKGGLSQGTRYQVKQDPGTSFTIACSPAIQVGGTGAVGPPLEVGDGTVSLSYKATAEPLEVVLSGGIGPKDGKQYLIGQKVTATALTGGLTATSYAWDVSGGAPFKSYAPGQNTATFTELNLATETGSFLTFHFKEPTAPTGLPSVA